ncbi:MAG: DNA polymerase III subunit delta' [Pseudomonadota bacterium]
MSDLPHPRDRRDWLGDPAMDAALRARLDDGSLSHGWLLCGPPGVGRATLAYRIARARLAEAPAPQADTLAVADDDKGARLVDAQAHPDLFVAEPLWDEKKKKFASEISVDQVRALGAFLGRTASRGGWRVIIVDPADRMNRNAANALLKALEEPPPRTLLLLVAGAPGRVLPTIRSRCRRLDVRPRPAQDIAAFLRKEGAEDDVDAVAAASAGRPGYALALALGAGGEAVAAVDAVLRAGFGRGEAASAVQRLTGKAGDARWPIFKPMLVDALRGAARAAVVGAPVSHTAIAASGAGAAGLLTAAEELASFLDRGEALNLDRAHMIQYAVRRLQEAAQ